MRFASCIRQDVNTVSTGSAMLNARRVVGYGGITLKPAAKQYRGKQLAARVVLLLVTCVRCGGTPGDTCVAILALA